MTEQPIGLTDHERALLTQALTELPDLIEQAHRADLDGTGDHSAGQPGSRPPGGLDLIAIEQDIQAAAQAVLTASQDAGAHLPPHDPRKPLEALSDPVWRDWYHPHWIARNYIYIQLRQARTRLRKLLGVREPTTYPCPTCGDHLRPQPGGTWLLCDSGHEHSIPTAITTERAVTMLGVTDMQLWQWHRRGKIQPVNPGSATLLWRPADIVNILATRRTA